MSVRLLMALPVSHARKGGGELVCCWASCTFSGAATARIDCKSSKIRSVPGFQKLGLGF